MMLLTSLAFGTEVDFDAVYIEGIDSITAADIAAAAELGYRIKLLGVAHATESGIEARVHPTLVPRGSAIAPWVGGTSDRRSRPKRRCWTTATSSTQPRSAISRPMPPKPRGRRWRGCTTAMHRSPRTLASCAWSRWRRKRSGVWNRWTGPET